MEICRRCGDVDCRTGYELIEAIPLCLDCGLRFESHIRFAVNEFLKTCMEE